MLNLNTADDVQIATQGYGVGNWYLVNGDKAKAKEIYERVDGREGMDRRSATSRQRRICDADCRAHIQVRKQWDGWVASI